MNVAELVEYLEDLDPETEVRLATQPNWPFEYSVGEIVLPDQVGRTCPNCDNDDVHGLKCYDCGQELEPADDGPGVVYLAENNQLGYLPGAVSSELGWRG